MAFSPTLSLFTLPYPCPAVWPATQAARSLGVVLDPSVSVSAFGHHPDLPVGSWTLLQSVLPGPPTPAPALEGLWTVTVAAAPVSCSRFAPSLPRPVRFSPMSLSKCRAGGYSPSAGTASRGGFSLFLRLANCPGHARLVQVLLGMPFPCSVCRQIPFLLQEPARCLCAPAALLSHLVSCRWLLAGQLPPEPMGSSDAETVTKNLCVLGVWGPLLGL